MEDDLIENSQNSADSPLLHRKRLLGRAKGSTSSRSKSLLFEKKGDAKKLSPHSLDQKSEGWACTICTYQNHDLMEICEACEASRGGQASGYSEYDEEKEFENTRSGDNIFSPELKKVQASVSHHAPDLISDDESDDDFVEGSLVRVKRGNGGANVDDDIIEEYEEEEERPGPSFPEFSDSFMTVRDLQRFRLTDIDFNSLMMTVASAREYEKAAKKMDASHEKKEKRREKKEEEKRQARKEGKSTKATKKPAKSRGSWGRKNRFYKKK